MGEGSAPAAAWAEQISRLRLEMTLLWECERYSNLATAQGVGKSVFHPWVYISHSEMRFVAPALALVLPRTCSSGMRCRRLIHLSIYISRLRNAGRDKLSRIPVTV